MRSALMRGLAAVAMLCVAGPSLADTGAAKIRYTLSIAGLPIGNAALDAAIDANAYRISASAKIGGILALVSDGKGAATASGRIGSGKPIAAGYALNTLSSDKRQTVQMVMAGGRISDLEISPPVIPRPDRVPVSEADKQGVIDPLSALLMPVKSSPGLDPSACNRTLAVFDGAQRFDVVLSYSRTEHVASGVGYSGPVVVCSARYVPISGHRTGREQTRFMAENRDLEVWLAPISGTSVLAPWRIVVGTQVGRLVIEAAKFVTGGPGLDTMKARAD